MSRSAATNWTNGCKTYHYGVEVGVVFQGEPPRVLHVTINAGSTPTQLSGAVTELLGPRWSPQQISRHLRLRVPDDPFHVGRAMTVSVTLCTN